MFQFDIEEIPPSKNLSIFLLEFTYLAFLSTKKIAQVKKNEFSHFSLSGIFMLAI